MTDAGKNIPRYYSLEYVAERLGGMPTDTLKRLTRRGEFVPRLRVGRRWLYRADLVEEFLQLHTGTGAPAELLRSERDLMDEARRRVVGRSNA